MKEISTTAVWVFLTAVLGAYGAAIVLTGPYAWDDGAITVSFARTLAETGNFALTGVSPRVEGTSSLLFTLLLVPIFAIKDLGFSTYILVAQGLSLLFLLGTLALLYAPLRGYGLTSTQSALLLGLFALIPLHGSEIVNGMEMTGFGFLLLGFTLLYQRASPKALLLIPLLLLVRFEAAFYLGLATLVLCLFDNANRRRHLGALATTVLVFAGFTLMRWVYFGDIIPNTVRAKMQPPYTRAQDLLGQIAEKFDGVLEFIDVTTAMLIIVATLVAAFRPASILRDMKLWLVVGFAVFAIASGKASGYDGRMFVGLLPVFLLLCLDLMRPHGTKAIFGVAMLTLLATTLGNLAQFERLEKLATLGAVRQGYVADPDQTLVTPRRAYYKIVNPANYRQFGRLADELRVLMRLETVSFMAPDAGGLGLCCALGSIKVIDSAMLTNPDLARSGYAGFAAHFNKTAPDLLVAHGMWASAPGLYEKDLLPGRYDPVIHRDTLFWIRRDRISDMLSRGVQFVPEPWDAGLIDLRNDFRKADVTYLKSDPQFRLMRIAHE